jgi:hypothetical protein
MSAFGFRIDRGVAILEYDGEWSVENIVEVHRRMAQDPEFRPAMPKIIVERARMRDLKLDDLLAVQKFLKEFYADVTTTRRIAMVSDDRPMEPLLKLFRDLYVAKEPKDSAEYRFFGDFAAAEAWAREGLTAD